MPQWIDFKKLRAKLSFETVLQHYGVEIKGHGRQHFGHCPLPGHTGKKAIPTFSANLDRGIFHCFACGGKGNVLEFAVLMEKGDAGDGATLKRVAVDLNRRFCKKPGVAQPVKNNLPVAKENFEAKALPLVINASLDFQLKGLDRQHPYLLGRGFTESTIAHFDLGFCSRGLLKDRVAIPLHDHAGQLIGYAGRVVVDAAASEANPSYLFPSKRERKGTLFEFRKSLFLYNGFRIKAPCEDLIVVEGFPSVWWLHQSGFPRVVALMDSECSEKQAELVVSLVGTRGRVWVMPKGNRSGERLAQSLLLQVSPHRFARWMRLEEDCQPTDLSAEELNQCFTS